MSAQSYRDLIVWQKARRFVREVYQISDDWPRAEQLGLTSQTRRAALSVPANIAEGKGRLGPREYVHHLSIARGSLSEAETLLLIAQDLAFVDEETVAHLLQQTDEIGRLLHALINSLRPSSPSRLTPHA